MNLISKFKASNKKLFDNSIAFFSSFFLQFTLQIIFPPLMIMIWGASNFGIILFLIAVPGSLAFLIINFNTPQRQEMGKAYVSKDFIGVNKIYTNTVLLLLINYLVYFLVSLFFLKFIEFERLNNTINNDEANLILGLIFISVLVGFFQNIFSMKVSYLGIYHIHKYIELLYDSAIKISILLIGLLSQSFIKLFIIYLILSLIRSIVYYLYSKKIKDTFFSINKIDTTYFKTILKKSMPYCFSQLEETAKTSVIILIIGIFFDFKTVAFITTIRTMFYFFPRKFFEIFPELLHFEYVKLLGKKHYAQLRKLYIGQNLLMFSLAIIYLLISYFFGSIIYDFWTKNEFIYDTKILHLLILDGFFFLLSSSLISFLKSINKFFSFSVFTIVSQITLIIIIYFSYLNGQNYEILFLTSFVLSFLIFFISIFYFKHSLNLMQSK